MPGSLNVCASLILIVFHRQSLLFSENLYKKGAGVNLRPKSRGHRKLSEQVRDVDLAFIKMQYIGKLYDLNLIYPVCYLLVPDFSVEITKSIYFYDIVEKNAFKQLITMNQKGSHLLFNRQCGKFLSGKHT